MKQDAAFLGEGRIELVYIARRLQDALRLESLLTAAGVDYAVEADRYRGGIVFQGERVGAFFYVRLETVEAAHRILRENGYRPHEPAPEHSESKPPDATP